MGKGDFTKDLLTLFTLVNYQVAHKYTNTQIQKYRNTNTDIIHVKVAHGKSSRPDGLKQIPEICSRLTKTLMFNSKPCFTE